MLSKQYLVEVSLDRDKVPSFDEYPFCLDAVKNLTTLRLHPAVTYLIGENGSGKSTLLEGIATAWGFNPEGGSRNFNFASYASHSELYRKLRLSRGVKKARDGFFLRAESFYNVASEIERLDQGGGGRRIIDSYGGASLHGQSHGESFLALMMKRFGGNGLYILDEPEAALSPTRQMALIARMHDLVRQESQFIIATHSPVVMAYPDAQIYHLDSAGIEPIGYEETEHFQVTRQFLNNPQEMLKFILEGEDNSE